MKILKTIICCLPMTLFSQAVIYGNPQSAASGAESAMADKSPKDLKPATGENKLDLETIIKKLKKWDAKLNTLQTDFSQEIKFKEAGLKKKLRGAVSYLKPNYLKIEHTAPEKQTIVTDKKIIWIFKPADNQVIKTSWDRWFKIQNGQFSGILDFGNYSKLIKKNNVALKSADPSRISIALTSKKNPSLYTLTLKLSSTDYFPINAILDLDETIIITSLINTKKNTDISKEDFKFTPPKSAEIITFGEAK